MSERMLVVPNTLCPAKFSTFPISETQSSFPAHLHPQQSNHTQRGKQASIVTCPVLPSSTYLRRVSYCFADPAERKKNQAPYLDSCNSPESAPAPKRKEDKRNHRSAPFPSSSTTDKAVAVQGSSVSPRGTPRPNRSECGCSGRDPERLGPRRFDTSRPSLGAR